MTWQNALIILVVGGLVLMAFSSYASSTAGNYLKNTFNGTPLEQSGEFLEDVGNSLMQTLLVVSIFMLLAAIIMGGIYIKYIS